MPGLKSTSAWLLAGEHFEVTDEDIVRDGAESIKRAVEAMEPGDKIIVERHEKSQHPERSLLTITLRDSGDNPKPELFNGRF